MIRIYPMAWRLVCRSIVPLTLLGITGDISANVETSFVESGDLGMPVLVVATSQSCPPCRALKHVMRTDQQVQELLERYVVLQLDVNSYEFEEFSRRVPHHLNMIPMVFMLRPDGKVLYAQSGGLSSDTLQRLLRAGVKASGRRLNESEAHEMSRRLDKAQELYDSGDIVNAYRHAAAVSAVPSYATSIVAADQLRQRIGSDVLRNLPSLDSGIRSPGHKFQSAVAITSLFVASRGDRALREPLGELIAKYERDPATQLVLRQAKDTVRGQLFEAYEKWDQARASYQRIVDTGGDDTARDYATQRLEAIARRAPGANPTVKLAAAVDIRSVNLSQTTEVAQLAATRSSPSAAGEYLELAEFYKRRHPQTATTYARLALERANSDEVADAARALLEEL